MPIEFINADLEIASSEDLEPIRAFFAQYGNRLSEMYCGSTDPVSYLASFEVHSDEDRDDQTAEEKIGAFCDSISELQGLAREVWEHATRRVIDLGYLADDLCSPFNDRLSVDTLRRMEELGLELALTIYPQRIRSQHKPCEATGENAAS
ncbi:hypothetical protein [Haloferula sargassicola]|uniref:hypothetical protein n=1 Tax=Haloferula sargassicola TaxID=490096 RepID=UPI003365AA9F